MSKKPEFTPFYGSFFDPFGIVFHTFFGIDFCIDFRRYFGCVSNPKWVQKGPQNRPKTAPKTHPKTHRKNDADLQPRGRVRSPLESAPLRRLPPGKYLKLFTLYNNLALHGPQLQLAKRALSVIYRFRLPPPFRLCP